MTPAVLFPDAATVVLHAIRPELAARSPGTEAAGRVPSPRPDRLVRVLRTGGPRKDLVTDTPQLTIDCWAPTDAAAHDLAQLVRALIGAMRGSTVDGVAVYMVQEFSGPQSLPDPLSDNPRYSFTVQLGLRGAGLA